MALVLALLLALAGLFALDRMMSTSNRSGVQVEAVESSALVQGFLAVHAEALQSIRGLYLDTTRAVSPSYFHSLVISMRVYAASFGRIWITDSSGQVVEEHSFTEEGVRLPEHVDLDTTHLLKLRVLAGQARATRVTQISPPLILLSGRRGVVLLEPIYVGPHFLGFAGGTITSEAILASIREGRPAIRGRLLILAGTDTIGATAPGSRFQMGVFTASSPLRTPGGGRWDVVVAQPSNVDRVRGLLWSVGLTMLAVLIVMLLHERRQGLRLAERSMELERLSTELLRANRAKSEFLANVSHELRTPLNAIVGFVELLRDGVYGELNPRQISPVDRMASSAGHLRQLVDQILDLSKMAAGRLDVHRELLDLRLLVLEVAGEVEPLVQERGLNFSISVSPSLPRLRTDPLHLRQILVNLLGNAIKFTPLGGIAIRARPAPANVSPPVVRGTGSHAWIILQVADTGVGIAPGDSERIFEEFEQVNAGPRTDSIRRGTGLGLPISRRLARFLGGDLTVESDLGKGATFTVWLPLDAVAASESENRQPESVAAVANAGRG
ncbi:MAG: ATP-binding protein [Gemmatimonadaceae bacterium]